MRCAMRRVAFLLLAGIFLAPTVLMWNQPTAQASDKRYRQVTAEDDAQSVRLRDEADTLRAQGEYARAAELYTKAIHLNERRGGYLERGYCYLKLGKYAQAERDAKTALYHQSARELIRPGVAGMAPFIQVVCAYHTADYQLAAEASQKVHGTRYAKDPEYLSTMQELARNPDFIACAVKFQETSVTVADGGVQVEGMLENISDAPITVTQASIALRATDVKGNVAWSDAQVLGNLAIEVPPGKSVFYSFWMPNDRCRAIVGEMQRKLLVKFG